MEEFDLGLLGLIGVLRIGGLIGVLRLGLFLSGWGSC